MKSSIENQEDKRLPLLNLYLIAASLVIIVVGLVVMYIGPDSESTFEPEIFSTRRIVIGPIITFIGFISVIVSILWQKKSKH